MKHAMERLAVFAAALLTLAGCAISPTPTTTQAATQSEPDPYSDQLSQQTRNPEMLAYIKKVREQPQPERARLGNELIRTNKLRVYCLFDADNPTDPAVLAAAGTVLSTSAGCEDTPHAN